MLYVVNDKSKSKSSGGKAWAYGAQQGSCVFLLKNPKPVFAPPVFARSCCSLHPSLWPMAQVQLILHRAVTSSDNGGMTLLCFPKRLYGSEYEPYAHSGDELLVVSGGMPVNQGDKCAERGKNTYS